VSSIRRSVVVDHDWLPGIYHLTILKWCISSHLFTKVIKLKICYKYHPAYGVEGWKRFVYHESWVMVSWHACEILVFSLPPPHPGRNQYSTNPRKFLVNPCLPFPLSNQATPEELFPAVGSFARFPIEGRAGGYGVTSIKPFQSTIRRPQTVTAPFLLILAAILNFAGSGSILNFSQTTAIIGTSLRGSAVWIAAEDFRYCFWESPDPWNII